MADAKKATKAKEEKVEEVTEVPIPEVTDSAVTDNVAVETETTEDSSEDTTEKKTAKAGKRSAKAIAEAEEKQAKEERKAHKDEQEGESKPKAHVKPARSHLERRGKNFRKAAELIQNDKTYSLKEALDLATKTNPVKFDATVEMHLRLNVDPRQADQNIRDTIVLPAGTGKSIRVAVFAEADDVTAAKQAGADVAGTDEFLQQLEKGVIDFDVLIATPSQMPKLGKYARVLGPKGLMPNPKSGTVTPNVSKAVKEAKAGRVEYRVDSTGIVHLGIGKVSFGGDKLTDNAKAVITSIKGNKPSSIKGSYVRSVYVTTAMGPSIKIDLNELNS